MNLKQSTSVNIPFLLRSSTDSITGLTGATPTVTLSKNGGSFAAAGGSVSEIGNGWYELAANTTDTGTLGAFLLYATAAGADPSDENFHQVNVELSGAIADKTGFSLSAGGIQAIWDALTSALITANSIGKLFTDNINASVSSRMATFSYTAPDNTTIGTTATVVTAIASAVSAIGTAITAIGTQATAIKVVTDKFLFDGSNYVKSAAQTFAAGAIQSIWDAATSALSTSGSIGALLVADLNTALSAIYSRIGAPVGASISADIAGIASSASLGGIRKNTAMAGFSFTMFDTSGNPALDLTGISAKVCIDGAAFVDCTNDPVEIGNGWYKIDLSMADTDGKVLGFKFTCAGCNPTEFSTVTDT